MYLFKSLGFGLAFLYTDFAVKIKTQVYDDILNTGAVQLEPGKPFFWNENDHYTGFVYFNFDLWMFLFPKQQCKLKKPIFSNKFWKANG